VTSAAFPSNFLLWIHR